MKSITKASGVVFAFLAISLFWSSCSVEQSTYSIDDVAGKATIKGKAYYNQGQKIENNVYKEDVVAVKNQKIFIDIANSSFTNFNNYDHYYNSNKGYTTFATTTDENGNYEIEIPATSLSYGTEIVIYGEDFTGNQTIITAIENGSPVYKTIESIYSYSRSTYRVYANESLIRDIKFEPTERETEDKQFAGTVPVKIKIGIGELEQRDSYPYIRPYLNFTSGVQATLTAIYNYNSWYDDQFEIQYKGTTNNEGEIELNVLLQKSSEYLSLTLKIESFRESRFIYPYQEYGNYDYDIYAGTYRQYYYWDFVDQQDLGTITFRLSQTPDVIEGRMVFEADPGDNVRYDYSNYQWEYVSFYNN